MQISIPKFSARIKQLLDLITNMFHGFSKAIPLPAYTLMYFCGHRFLLSCV